MVDGGRPDLRMEFSEPKRGTESLQKGTLVRNELVCPTQPRRGLNVRSVGIVGGRGWWQEED